MADFNDACLASLSLAKAICEERGTDYQDSWSLKNLHTQFLDSVLREMGITDTTPKGKRLIVIASLCDVKLSRLLGEYKPDTYLDLINYIAALSAWLAE